jgi:hypothetical protein
MRKTMDKVFYCDICGAPMVLEEKLPNHKFKLGVFRRRRFKCTICDYKKLIIAGGSIDEEYQEQKGAEAVDKIFKQEEINRLGRTL